MNSNIENVWFNPFRVEIGGMSTPGSTWGYAYLSPSGYHQVLPAP